MYKALGVILLSVGCVYYIYTLIYERKERLKNLSEIKKAVICFKNELSFNIPEIAVLCEKASDKTGGEISRIFSCTAKNLYQDKNTDFRTAWARVCENKKLFSDETDEILCGFFDDFGKKSLEIELSNLDRILLSLEEKEKLDEKKYAEDKKLICTLGAAFCATVIIIAI